MVRLGWVFLWLTLLVWLGFATSDRALASVHQYAVGSNRVMVRSLQTLRDRRDQAWQLVLFKQEESGQTESIHLRLVGFPGAVQFQHSEALRISTTGHDWVVAALLNSYLANVGEYDVLEAIEQLTSNAPLQLLLPTKSGDVEITVPPFVVKEWRQVALH